MSAAAPDDHPHGTPRVFTVPPGAPFLETLGAALFAGRLVPGFEPRRDPLAMASATILVPTRRAARALASTLAAQADAPALLLPQILPLGGLDAIETGLLFEEGAFADPLGTALPAAVEPLPRRLMLTRLILQWAAAVRRAIVAVGRDGTRTLHPHEELLVATSAADAFGLAGDLGTLSDELAAEGIAWDKLAPLGTDSYDQYWRITLDFLKIVVESWPAILAERGEIDAAERQRRLIEAEIARLRRGVAEGPIVVAGAVGTDPVTARLIATVAGLPQGAVVLPGLDQSLDAIGWGAVGDLDTDTASHPQFGLKRLLGAIGVGREEVVRLGTPPAALAARNRFVSEAMRPATTTETWREFAAAVPAAERDGALAAVSMIEAADEREEALALAILLREALERPGTAMLVTPDRGLGLRVREELARWHIDIDVSSGEPLGATPAGAVARLVLDAAVQDLAPVEVLALLAHPLARFGRPRAEVARLARTLEIAILRGVLPPRALHDPAGLIDMARARRGAAHAPDALTRLSDGDFSALARFLDDVVAALEPLHRLRAGNPMPGWVEAHAAVVEAVTAMPEGTALTGIDGNALAALFEGLDEAPQPGIVLDAAGYAALFDRIALETPVRGPNRSHPRLKILGLLEARLLTADLVLLGGLDEGVWPPQTRTDAFLNRPMRASLGLPAPERRIGQAAHDLAMQMGAERVVLSRAAKRGGSPTVPSRFLLRMAALAGEGWTACRARGAATLALARALDRPAAVRAIARPAPRPPVDLRPQRLSVTRIETLRRDPYAIFAERVLELSPVDPIAAAPGPREYGTSFHRVMADFSRRIAAAGWPPEGLAGMLAATEAAFADQREEPAFRTFLWPRIANWARAFHDWEQARQGTQAIVAVESRGRLRLPLLDGSIFELTAEADRIEVGHDNAVTVIDYKTGQAPSARTVKAGFAPQLTLEAAMVERGAFPDLPADARVEAARYLKFESSGAIRPVELTWRDAILPDVVASHFEGLVTLLNLFRDPATGYLARPYPQYANRFSDFDHLSRVGEWASAGDGGDEA